MERDMVKIDETLCDGCGACIPNCHEGALQIIDGKARLVSDLMCDGLGACIGHCPQGAISIERREAEAYNEEKVMALMVSKGENTVVAHLQHLRDHQETGYLKEGVSWLMEHENELGFRITDVLDRVHNVKSGEEQAACGCPGSAARSFAPQAAAHTGNPMAGRRIAAVAAGAGGIPGGAQGAGSFVSGGGMAGASAAGDEGIFPGQLSMPGQEPAKQASQLRQWPVQMHLINPGASCFRQADVVLAADCVAFSLGDFHSRWLAGKSLAIACPKLDSGLESYVEKIRALVDDAKINTLTVMMMHVPCCGGLIRLVDKALGLTNRKVPVKMVIVSAEGEILQEEWN
ncbi:MAG: 4Fe-4S ferredoxin [Bacteroidetes bacterium]|nr:MAG: 4Fe-4S ferredoxin [Bacteroidota bacterium]